MIVYPDTSFIFSLWHKDDVNHDAAQMFFTGNEPAQWLWCDLHEIEFPVAVQVATHREKNPLQPNIAKAVIFRAQRAARRLFLQKELPTEAKRFALSLAEKHGWKKRLTAFDLWHLGAAFELGCDTFATFDVRQSELARSAKFRVNPLN
jgi:predicted nucleic acid-binding protein